MAEYPSYNDNIRSLWKKIAWNWYDIAVNRYGASGLNPPKLSDNDEILIKKTCYYSAVCVDLHP